MKKGVSVFFIFISMILLIGAFTLLIPTKTVLAYGNYDGEIKSESAYLVEEKTGTVLYAKNENKKLPIASMCKIMTLLCCFDNVSNGSLDLNSSITVSENASSMGGSQVFLEKDGKYLVKDLIKAITVASANDACVALAESISGSENEFVNLMNQKAKEIGASNTNFTNCTGLPREGQYSCAKDVSIMFRNLIKHEEYFEFSKIWMDVINHPKNRITEISNTNKLIKFYNGCDGGKTGYTSEAGHCLCATAKKGDTRLVSVVIKAPNSKTRFAEISSMFNYGFNNYQTKEIIKKGDKIDAVLSIKHSNIDSPKISADSSVYACLNKNEKKSFEHEFTKIENLKAPLKKGDTVGFLTVYCNNVQYAKINVILDEDIMQKSLLDNIKDVTINWNLI